MAQHGRVVARGGGNHGRRCRLAAVRFGEAAAFAAMVPNAWVTTQRDRSPTWMDRVRDRATVSSQVSGIYRKLAVSSRARRRGTSDRRSASSAGSADDSGRWSQMKRCLTSHL